MSEAANRYSKLATDLTTEAAPQRQLVGDYYSNVVKGGPGAYKLIAPQVDFTKRQFSNARRTMDQGVAPGGARQRGYKQLASAEAGTVSNLMRDKINEVLARLASFSQFGTQAGISSTGGVMGAGQGLAELSAQRAAAAAQGLGGVAGALGTFFGMRGGG